ncbi:hypothetical protein NL676_029183 [Syzygium grande]|nr:hypothetical protein NL676_029183 [Syzygium grande]
MAREPSPLLPPSHHRREGPAVVGAMVGEGRISESSGVIAVAGSRRRGPPVAWVVTARSRLTGEGKADLGHAAWVAAGGARPGEARRRHHDPATAGLASRIRPSSTLASTTGWPFSAMVAWRQQRRGLPRHYYRCATCIDPPIIAVIYQVKILP